MTFGQIVSHNRKASKFRAVRNRTVLAQDYFNIGIFESPSKIVIFTLQYGRSCVLEKRESLNPIKPYRMRVEYFKRITEMGSVSTKQRPGVFVLRLSGAVCVCTHNPFVYHYCCSCRRISGTMYSRRLTLSSFPMINRLSYEQIFVHLNVQARNCKSVFQRSSESSKSVLSKCT